MLRQCAHRPKAIQAPFDVGFGLVPMSDSSSPGCRGPGRRRARATEALLRYGVSRRRRTRTTRGDSGRRAAPDRIGRQFDADLPDRLWIPTCPRVAPGAGTDGEISGLDISVTLPLFRDSAIRCRSTFRVPALSGCPPNATATTGEGFAAVNHPKSPHGHSISVRRPSSNDARMLRALGHSRRQSSGPA